MVLNKSAQIYLHIHTDLADSFIFLGDKWITLFKNLLLFFQINF